MDILSIDLNNINLGDANYHEDNPETVIHVRFLAGHIKFEKRKDLNEELMIIVWHPRRCGVFSCQKMRKKKFLLSNTFNA